ncbi:unnamed protein product [Peronospora farinosa]|uniref:Uncharacterized protein n=1 Tax=Peronospora farinosa TaxID=134698 RepID=A0AAV0SU17_9STRA|nr:unnamed protein product [Peronospora farinosa]
MTDKKLVFVAALTARGVLVQFMRDQAVLISDNVNVAVINRAGKLFAWNVKQHITLEAHKAESIGAINDTMARSPRSFVFEQDYASDKVLR